MIVQLEKPSLEQPWRFAIVPLEAHGQLADAAGAEHYEIDGHTVTSMRAFHEEVAADFFFASHYNCDPQAPLSHLDAPVAGQQILIWWHAAWRMAETAFDEWEAILQMFRAAMATLHPQGSYLRLLFPTDDPAGLRLALTRVLHDEAEVAGVGFDYEAGASHFDILHETMSRTRPPGG